MPKKQKNSKQLILGLGLVVVALVLVLAFVTTLPPSTRPGQVISKIPDKIESQNQAVSLERQSSNILKETRDILKTVAEDIPGV